MRHTEYTASVKQDHNGFLDDGYGHEAFQRIKSSKPRRNAEAQEAFAARKGKRNKQGRTGRVDWDIVECIRFRPNESRTTETN